MSIPNCNTTNGGWTLRKLLARSGVREVGGGTSVDVNITSLTDDSREVRRGSCFVAIRGIHQDGHRFVEDAVRAGAGAIIVEDAAAVPKDIPSVQVKSTPIALAKLAATFFGLQTGAAEGLRLIGITGTNGKTTVAWMLRSILQEADQPAAMLGTIEYDLVSERRPAPLTTPGALDLCRHLAHARDAGGRWGILEISSHALEQRRCDGLSLAAGVFTNLSGDHLDYHTTMESYGAAKRHLFDLLQPAGVGAGVAIINRDDPFGQTLIGSLGAEVVSFSLNDTNADVTGRITSMDTCGSDFVLGCSSFELPVRLSLLGEYNIANALAAAATADALGILPDVIRAGLEHLRGVPGRLQRVEPPGRPFSVLVDYAHTDRALENVLKALRPLTKGRLICVFGCGGDRDRGKRPRMAAVTGRFADLAFVTSDNPRTEDPERIIEEILPGFGPSPTCRVEVQVDRRRAIESAIAQAGDGDTVLIAGKGHEDYQLVGDAVLPFDDAIVARKCMDTVAVTGEVA